MLPIHHAILGASGNGPYSSAVFRQVTNRCDVPSLSLGAALASGQTTRTKHKYYGRRPTNTLKIGYANFFLNSGVTGETVNTDTATTVKCAIEVNGSPGTYTDVTFSGSTTLSHGASDFTLSDAMNIGFTLKPGDTFWIRTLYTAPTNALQMQSVRNTPQNNPGGEDEWVVVGNFLHGGETSVTAGNKPGGSAYWPCAILAQSGYASFAHIGDSKGWGQNETQAGDGTAGDRGWASKWISARGYGHLRLSKSGDKAQNVAGVNGRPKCFQLMKACGVTHLIVPLGINDLDASQTRAQTIASLKTIATRAKDPTQGNVLKCMVSTSEPRVSQLVVNADWSLANQQDCTDVNWQGTAAWAGFNDDIRAFTTANSGYDAFFEIADVVTPGRGVARYNDAIPGFGAVATGDGVHPINGTLHALMAASLQTSIP